MNGDTYTKYNQQHAWKYTNNIEHMTVQMAVETLAKVGKRWMGIHQPHFNLHVLVTLAVDRWDVLWEFTSKTWMTQPGNLGIYHQNWEQRGQHPF